MKRMPLSSGCSVKSKTEYFIDGVLGDGANCIVYDAHFKDDRGYSKRIILKECYPVSAAVTRKDSLLIWRSESERNTAFARMEDTYRLLNEIQTLDLNGLSKTYALETFEQNGTQYIATIPEGGNSYDNDIESDLKGILLTALALCNAVGQYHQFGYLHLDIKPSNFIASYDNTKNGKNVVLFDIDTLVKIDDLTTQPNHFVPYSERWAAPEQQLQYVSKLCPATDLYAIGSILFEKIMNRSVEIDDMNPFTEWNYDERFDVKLTNPRVKRLLTEVFHKSLCANPKRRYQSADEMAAVLDEIIKVLTSGTYYIIPSCPVSNCKFVGRTEELKELENGIKENQIAFVIGSGGIGKTEFVKKYIETHQHQYDAVVFVRYQDSVIEAIGQIKIKGFSGTYDEKLNLLHDLCNDSILFVLDNFDVALEKSNDLNTLLGFGCDTIITSRTDFSEIYPKCSLIRLGGLSNNELKRVFVNEANVCLSSDDFEKLLPVFELGKECTYFWLLLSRLVKAGEYSIEEIVEKILSGSDSFENSENVIDTKDGITTKTTVVKALSNLFKLERFSSVEMEVLKAFYYLSVLRFSKNAFKECAHYCQQEISSVSIMNAFNNLCEMGYITKIVDDSYVIHDVLRNVLDYELNILLSDSLIIKNYVEKHLFSERNILSKIPHEDAMTTDAQSYRCEQMLGIMCSASWDYAQNADYCINILFDMIGGNYMNYRYFDNKFAPYILENIEYILTAPTTERTVAIKATVLLISFYCYLAITEVDEEELLFEDLQKVEKLFVKTVADIDIDDIDEELVLSIYKPIFLCCTETGPAQLTICRSFSGEFLNQVCQNYSTFFKTDDYDELYEQFTVKCLLNGEFEKCFLKETLDCLHDLPDDKKSFYAYQRVGRILVNGGHVSRLVDEELQRLRKKVFSYCCNLFNSDSLDTSDFVSKKTVAPPALFLYSGLHNYLRFINVDATSSVKANGDCKNTFVAMDEITDDDLEDFSNSVCSGEYNDNHYDCLLIFHRFIKKVAQAGEYDLSALLLQISDVIRDEFENADISKETVYGAPLTKDFLNAYLNALNAVIVDITNDTERADAYLSKVFDYCQDNIACLSQRDIIHFNHALYINTLPVDKPFWLAIKSIKNRHMAILYLIRYTEVVKRALNVNENDLRLYEYYKAIVEILEVEIKKLKSIVSDSRSGLQQLLIEIYGDNSIKRCQQRLDEYNLLLKKYKSLTDTIIGRN